MSLTRAAFIDQFPEFAATADRAAGQTLIDAMLAAALLEIDPDSWGDKSDQGQAYLAAHKLAVSPWGNASKLSNKDGTSTYGAHYQGLLRQVSGGGLLL